MSKEDCICEEIIDNVVRRVHIEFYQTPFPDYEDYKEILELTAIIFSANTEDLEDRVYEITKRHLKERLKEKQKDAKNE